MEQLCTTLEEAYWDYKDLYVADNPDVFPPLTFKEFVEQRTYCHSLWATPSFVPPLMMVMVGLLTLSGLCCVD